MTEDSHPPKTCKTGRRLLMRGIDYLSRREYSQAELRRKLAPHAQSTEELEDTLERLKKENWQSDERFLNNFIQAKSPSWGNAKVLYALRTHELAEESLDQVRQELKHTERERALEVYQRKYKSTLSEVEDTQKEYARRVRFMLSRGFSAEVVRWLLKHQQSHAED